MVCSNGAIARGKKFHYKPDKERVRAYFSNLHYLFEDFKNVSIKSIENLRSQFSMLANEKIYDDELMKAWLFLNKIFDQEKVDSILRLKTDERKSYQGRVDERNKSNETLPFINRIAPKLTEHGMYDVFNGITDVAKEEEYEVSLKLQVFGGNMLFWRGN